MFLYNEVLGFLKSFHLSKALSKHHMCNKIYYIAQTGRKVSISMTTTNLQNVLVYNNRFANVKISAEQISAESFAEWKTLVSNLHRAAYKVYALCENSGMKVESASVNKSEVFEALRAILEAIGNVNEHKLYANAEAAITIISYSGKRSNVDAPELQLCKSRINNAKKELKLSGCLNGISADYISNLEQNLTTLEAEKETLMATADMCHKQPTKTSDNAFRLDLEHFLARVITGQLAKTLEELDAEEAARKEARKASAKARKANKANSTK